MKYKELVKKLDEDGWILVRSNKHRIYRHPVKKKQLTIPLHSGEIPTGTAARILKDAGIL
jgi:predicted RNA binding protein YcfA (HicA-like mRNA interferase family)